MDSQKEGHWVSVLAVAVFIILSLGVIAFLYYQNQSLKSILATYQTPIGSPKPSAEAATPIATLEPSPEATKSAKPTISPTNF